MPGMPTGGGAAGAQGGAGLLGGVLDMVRGGLGSAAQHPGQAGGMGAVVGALMGGGRGAVQGGMMAVLASVAMQALSSAGEQQVGGQSGGAPGGGLGALLGGLIPGGGQPSGAAAQWSGGDMPLGMRAPQNTAEEEALEATAQLVLKGMINAAKSDGQISPDEMQRIVGKLQESGADAGMQQWVMQEMQTPLNAQAFAAEIPNQEVAAQVYAASLLAVEVDTDAERRYLEQFAEAAGLHPLVVRQIHQTLGVAVYR
jgi:uncharacterized membrane protein YebE (DUF533 family)